MSQLPSTTICASNSPNISNASSTTQTISLHGSHLTSEGDVSESESEGAGSQGESESGQSVQSEGSVSEHSEIWNLFGDAFWHEGRVQLYEEELHNANVSTAEQLADRAHEKEMKMEEQLEVVDARHKRLANEQKDKITIYMLHKNMKVSYVDLHLNWERVSCILLFLFYFLTFCF